MTGGRPVPQIWLTYDELAALMDCNAAAARMVAAAVPLTRRRSRDGHTRAKLNGALTEIYLDRMSRERHRDPAGETTARGTTAYSGKLWTLLEQMAGFTAVKALPAPSPGRDEISAPRG
jgi:hypothetical protein